MIVIEHDHYCALLPRTKSTRTGVILRFEVRRVGPGPRSDGHFGELERPSSSIGDDDCLLRVLVQVDGAEVDAVGGNPNSSRADHRVLDGLRLVIGARVEDRSNERVRP